MQFIFDSLKLCTMKHLSIAFIPFILGLAQGKGLSLVCPPDAPLMYFANPYDCTLYYECYQGNLYEMGCAIGLEWNPTTSECVLPYLSGCTAKQTSVAPPDVTPDPSCPYPSDTITYDIDPSNCQRFFECYQGKRYGVVCPNNLYWNHVMNYCDDFEEVDCSRGRVTTVTPTYPTGPTPLPTCFYSESSVYYYDPTDCKKVYDCNKGTLYSETCPDGLYWNHIQNYCDDFDNVDCTRGGGTVPPPTTAAPISVCSNLPDGALVPHPWNPSKFYECVRGIPVTFTCEGKQVFDPVKLVCVDA
ncbi:peritrophin-44 [Leptinotarsa decemlineata]